MTTRKRHLQDDESLSRYVELICSVCATESQLHDATTEFTPMGESDKRTVCLCEDCQQDFISETVQDYPENVFNSDVLPLELFEQVLDWAKMHAVLAFTEKENTPKTIADVEEFFDALTAYLNWHPDNKFRDYVNGSGANIFNEPVSAELDELMDVCNVIIESEAKGDIYDYAIKAFQRAGLAPKDDTKTELHQEAVAKDNEQKVYDHTMGSTRGEPVSEEEMSQENAALNRKLTTPTTTRTIFLAETQVVLMFDSEDAFQLALSYADGDNEGTITEYLKRQGVRFTQWAVDHVAFEQK